MERSKKLTLDLSIGAGDQLRNTGIDVVASMVTIEALQETWVSVSLSGGVGSLDAYAHS